jgi:hypothetical protein
MICSFKYFPALQIYLYAKNNDIVFSTYSTGIFSIAFFFIALIINNIIIETILSIIPGMKNAFLWYEVSGSKTSDFFSYKTKNKKNIIFILFILIVASFFSISALFVHLRINNSGIYYTKIFEFKETYYNWTELKSVYVYPKVTKGRRGSKNLSPEMILEFGKNKLDIWDGAGLGSPNSEILIKIIDILNENSSIKINVDNNFSDEMVDLLYNHSTEWKRNNIINVFNYLDKKQ